MTFEPPGGGARAGIHVDGAIVDLRALMEVHGRELPGTVFGLLQMWPGVLDELRPLAAEKPDTERWPLADVKLLAPVPRPGKIFALAQNYADHIVEGAEGVPLPPKEGRMPLVFCKLPSSVVGPGEPILIPPISDTVDWELELAAVVGRRARNVSVERALEVVAGYTVFNDISARTLTYTERTVFGETEEWFDFLTGKWCDSFSAMGPFLVTADAVADPGVLDLQLRVNGTLYQDGNTREMIHKLAEVIAFISRWSTLEPGDVIATGTPAGTGAASGVFLKPGDIVEGEIRGIGTLVNPVLAAPTEEWVGPAYTAQNSSGAGHNA